MLPWMKQFRDFTEWYWYSDVNVSRVYHFMFLRANEAPSRWQGIEIARGEYVTSLNSLSDKVNLSVQKVRTALEKLENSGEISIKSTNRFTVIKLLNYEVYSTSGFSNQQTDNNQITNNQQTDNNQITTSKEVKNLRNIDIYNNYIYNSDFAKIISLYEQNIGVPSPVARETLLELFSSHSADLVELAIEEAAKANARNIRYIEGIFRNWDNEGIKTVESAKLAIAERRLKSDAAPKQRTVSAKPRKNSFQDYDDEITDFDTMIINRRLQKDYE